MTHGRSGRPTTVELTDAHVATIELITDLRGMAPSRVQILVRWRPDPSEVIAFRPDRLELEDSSFDIYDILVGNRSQFVQRGPIPGSLFTSSAIDAFVHFDTLQTAMDFEIVAAVPYAKYDADKGVSFKAKLRGLAAMAGA